MRLLIETLCVVWRAAGSFAEMLWQAFCSLVQMALWLMCLLFIAGAFLTGVMAVVTHRPDCWWIAAECAIYSLVMYVVMALVEHFRHDRRQQQSQLGRGQDGRINLPHVNPWV